MRFVLNFLYSCAMYSSYHDISMLLFFLDARYNCDNNNPCTSENNQHYWPAESETQYIQCGGGTQCFVQDCSPGTVWSQGLNAQPCGRSNRRRRHAVDGSGGSISNGGSCSNYTCKYCVCMSFFTNFHSTFTLHIVSNLGSKYSGKSI